MQVKIIQNLDQLINIKTEYCKLYDEAICADVFISYQWLINTIKYFVTANDTIQIITIWESTNIIALLPLCVRKQKKIIFNFKYLTHLSFRYADYCSFLINKNSNYQAIFRVLIKAVLNIANTCNCIKIDNVSTKDNLLILFYTKLLPKMQKAQLFTDIENPILNLRYPIDKKEHNNVLKRRVKLQNNNYKFKINDIKNPLAWDKMFLFRRAKHGNKSIFISNTNKMFFQSLTNAKLSTLEVNNEIVAVHYGFIDKEIFYHYIPAYSQNMKKNAVGKVLILEIIEWCKNKNIKEFNFLRGLEIYKIPWTIKVLDNKIFFAILNNTIKNKIIYYLFLIIILYRKFIKQ
jgi:hypothetical protein